MLVPNTNTTARYYYYYYLLTLHRETAWLGVGLRAD